MQLRFAVAASLLLCVSNVKNQKARDLLDYELFLCFEHKAKSRVIGGHPASKCPACLMLHLPGRLGACLHYRRAAFGGSRPVFIAQDCKGLLATPGCQYRIARLDVRQGLFDVVNRPGISSRIARVVCAPSGPMSGSTFLRLRKGRSGSTAARAIGSRPSDKCLVCLMPRPSSHPVSSLRCHRATPGRHRGQ